MARVPLVVRDARAADVPALLELWGAVLRRGEAAAQEEDLRSVLASVEADPTRRLVVAECDGVVAGATLLSATTLTDLNLEPVVQVLSPHVHGDYRARGVGSALFEAAVSFADEQGIALLVTGVIGRNRDVDRFMARLGLSPTAVLRVAPTHVVRTRLAGRLGRTRPGRTRTGNPQLTSVLAARRSLRKTRQP